LRYKRVPSFEELVERFGATFEHDYQVVLAWPCTPTFQKMVSNKIRKRCKKFVINTYVRRSEGAVVLRLSECHMRSSEQLLMIILYEAWEIINEEPTHKPAPRAKSRRKKRTKHHPVRRKPVLVV
jgi:hypothetical protein